MLLKILNDPTPPILSKWSPEFQDFVNKCMEKDPESRVSADDLLKHPFLDGAQHCKKEFADVIRNFVAIKTQKSLFM